MMNYKNYNMVYVESSCYSGFGYQSIRFKILLSTQVWLLLTNFPYSACHLKINFDPTEAFSELPLMNTLVLVFFILLLVIDSC